MTINKEWNAGVYHRISTPQQTWGAQVLTRLPLKGNETVIDAGCGSGLLTAELLERLPEGRVIALDYSANMLAQARAHLEPDYADRVAYIEADLGRLDEIEIPGPVDAIFSTATFHWVHDHPRLFRGLADLLKPGGRLVAQCGGGDNIKRVLDRAQSLMQEAEYAPYFEGFLIPMYFATVPETIARLEAAGFTKIEVGLIEKPTPFADAGSFREFLTNVIFHYFIERLPTPASREAFINRLVDAAAGDIPPFTVDYWRLNIDATRNER